MLIFINKFLFCDDQRGFEIPLLLFDLETFLGYLFISYLIE